MVREYIGEPSEVRSDSSPTYCSEEGSAHIGFIHIVVP